MERAHDDYGYVAATSTALGLFETMSRRSGRTARLIARLQPNDRIIVPNDSVARYVRFQLREAGRGTVTVVVSNPNRQPLEIGTKVGHTYFDHTYVLERLSNAVRSEAMLLRQFEAAMSNSDPAPMAAGPFDRAVGEMRFMGDRR